MWLNREHSKAQHSIEAQPPPQKAEKQVRADQSTYQKKYERTCMLRPVCFPGASSSWHLQVACLHLKCWTVYFITTSVCHSNPCFFVSERSGRNRCTDIRTATAVQQQNYVRVSMLSLNRDHSTAQHSTAVAQSPLLRAQCKQRPSSCRSEYVSKEVPFVFREHGALGICKSPACT